MGGDADLPTLLVDGLAHILLAPEVADGLLAVEAEFLGGESQRTLLIAQVEQCDGYGPVFQRLDVSCVSVCGRAACARTCLACKYSKYFRKTAECTRRWPLSPRVHFSAPDFNNFSYIAV